MNSKKIIVSEKNISHIEFDDAYDYTTRSKKVLANIDIHIKDGIKKYRLLRTSKGKYVMQ